ncbi:hypothetical protein [Streptomyces sp. NPDC006997]|uniref:hypothetical protein n=1 Tax=Streptomyces sp. NPDC006997 TaxID=3155356 RepID=UPI0033CEAEC8
MREETGRVGLAEKPGRLPDGDPPLSLRGDEAGEPWRVVTPVLGAWERDPVPLEEYPAGSDGPPARPGGERRSHDATGPGGPTPGTGV